MNSVNSTITFETKQESKQETKQVLEEKDPLYHILEKQAKGFEDFGKRMSKEFHSTCQEYIKQKNELKFRTISPTCQCKEKDELINSLRARIEELENDSNIKGQEIKKLQKNVQYLNDIIVKKGLANIEEIDDIQTAKITVTTEKGEEIYDSESTKLVDVEEVEEVEDEDYYKTESEKDKLSVERSQYYNGSYSDSAMDMFTDDDDDSSTAGDSVKTENYEDSNYDRLSEWLDISPSLKQLNKIDKRNLDRWNSKMANNGLLPITLVGKVDEERERKIQTHRKRYSTSAIWLKTYENKRKQDQQNQDHDKFKIPSFNFPFNDVKPKRKESKELSAPISLKSSVSTSVSDLYTTSLPTTATTSLQPYELLEHHKNKPIHYTKSQQLLSQYK